MMTNDSGQRIATSTGAILVDAGALAGSRAIGNEWAFKPGSEPMFESGVESGVESEFESGFESVFEPGFWARRGELVDVTAGRGAAWFIGESGRWALRHYRRGGWVARLSRDRYVWCGEDRVRAFAEWRLLAELSKLGLPVPKPIAARYQRRGLLYRCDLVTARIPDTRSLSALLNVAPLGQCTWREVGGTVARLHAVGADHADLNAHNILVDGRGAVSVIDFDRGRRREPGSWARGNLARLHRSLVKIAHHLPPDRFSAETWDWLLAGYAAAPAHAATQ